MSRLAGAVEGVIGVDPHRDTLAAAATDPVGGLLAQTSVRADAAGYQRVLDFARAQVPGRRCWAVEGAGSHGAGLVAFLEAKASRWGRLADPSGRRGAAGPRATPWTPSAPPEKRWPSTISWRRVVVGIGRRCGCCAGWPSTADHALRAAARPAGPVAGAPHDRPGVALDRPPHPAAGRRGRRAPGRAGPAGRRHRAMAARAAWRRPDQRRPGAGQLVPCWPTALGGRLRRPGRRQPDPGLLRADHQASADRSGDRQLNRALHTIVLARLRNDPTTRAYAARRRAEGKSVPEVRRCLKRAVARRLFKLLERCGSAAVEIAGLR